MCKDIKGIDKLYHFLVCFGLTLIFPPLAMVLAVAKEVKDSTNKDNHFCVWDIVADVLGILVGLIPHGYLWNWLFG